MTRLRVYSGDQEADDTLSVAVTGIGMVSSVGQHREEVWQALQRGQLGSKLIRNLGGVPTLDLPVAMCDWVDPSAPCSDRAIELGMSAAGEALTDCGVDLNTVDRTRFAVSTSAHFGDTQSIDDRVLQRAEPSHVWWNGWIPSTGCCRIGQRFGLEGSYLCYSTACASSLISVIMAARHLFDKQCDYVLAGGMETVQPLLAAAFQRMGVLAPAGDDAGAACRPFDRQRSGFVLGEGAAMMVLERTVDAKRRGAKIYGEIVASKLLGEAAHVTSLDESGDSLVRLLHSLLRQSGWRPENVDYINAHGTGTDQNDRNELTAFCRVFGEEPEQLAVSSIKGMIGHTINAAGSIELAATFMAMRDGFCPSTRNLFQQEPIGHIDCLSDGGTMTDVSHAIKMSVAFGGHLAAVALQKSAAPYQRQAQPLDAAARVRTPSTAAMRALAQQDRFRAASRKTA
jgi:3-oxoacyl-[acyl-carrier-protein] synthase II